MDPGEPDSESDSGEPDRDEPTLYRAQENRQNRVILRHEFWHRRKNASASIKFEFQKEWVTEKYTA
jgi:hypothetical protein